MEGDKPLYGTAIVKAFLILESLAEAPGSIGVTAIARRTGVSKGTVSKLLATLQQLGYVRRDHAEARYSVGVGALRLSRAAISHMGWVGTVRPYLERLNQVTGETVHLGTLDQQKVIYVEKLESTRSIRMYSSVGKSAPLYCTGLGKAILSRLPDWWVTEYLNSTPFHQLSGNTKVAKAELLDEIQQIRTNGYAIDDGEHEEEVRCVAVPLHSHRSLYGAMSISAPKYRMDEQTMATCRDMLLSAAEELTEELSAHD